MKYSARELLIAGGGFASLVGAIVYALAVPRSSSPALESHVLVTAPADGSGAGSLAEPPVAGAYVLGRATTDGTRRVQATTPVTAVRGDALSVRSTAGLTLQHVRCKTAAGNWIDIPQQGPVVEIPRSIQPDAIVAAGHRTAAISEDRQGSEVFLEPDALLTLACEGGHRFTDWRVGDNLGGALEGSQDIYSACQASGKLSIAVDTGAFVERWDASTKLHLVAQVDNGWQVAIIWHPASGQRIEELVPDLGPAWDRGVLAAAIEGSVPFEGLWEWRLAVVRGPAGASPDAASDRTLPVSYRSWGELRLYQNPGLQPEEALSGREVVFDGVPFGRICAVSVRSSDGTMLGRRVFYNDGSTVSVPVRSSRGFAVQLVNQRTSEPLVDTGVRYAIEYPYDVNPADALWGGERDCRTDAGGVLRARGILNIPLAADVGWPPMTTNLRVLVPGYEPWVGSVDLTKETPSLVALRERAADLILECDDAGVFAAKTLILSDGARSHHIPVESFARAERTVAVFLERDCAAFEDAHALLEEAVSAVLWDYSNRGWGLTRKGDREAWGLVLPELYDVEIAGDSDWSTGSELRVAWEWRGIEVEWGALSNFRSVTRGELWAPGTNFRLVLHRLGEGGSVQRDSRTDVFPGFSSVQPP